MILPVHSLHLHFTNYWNLKVSFLASSVLSLLNLLILSDRTGGARPVVHHISRMINHVLPLADQSTLTGLTHNSPSIWSEI